MGVSIIVSESLVDSFMFLFDSVVGSVSYITITTATMPTIKNTMHKMHTIFLNVKNDYGSSDSSLSFLLYFSDYLNDCDKFPEFA